MNTMEAADRLRAELEAISDAAWRSAPRTEHQAAALWSCVWSAEGGELGDTFVAPPRRALARELAARSGCWWMWDERGVGRVVDLALASVLLAGPLRVPMNETIASGILRSIRPTLDSLGQEAIDYVLERPKAMVDRASVVQLLRKRAAGTDYFVLRRVLNECADAVQQLV